MKVILIKDVKNLGKRAEVKEVSEGHARNFLIPQGLAVTAGTSQAKSVLDDIKESQRRLTRIKIEQRGFAEKLSGKIIELERQATPEGSLYAAIHPQDISKEVARKLHLALNPDTIKINEPIKRVGAHKVRYGEGETQSVFTVKVVVKSRSASENKHHLAS